MPAQRTSALPVALAALVIPLLLVPPGSPAAAQALAPAEPDVSRQDGETAASPPEVTMDAAANAAAPTDPALRVWRDEVLPGIRELLAAGRAEIAALAATRDGPADAERERETNRRLEALKLDLERQVLDRQLQWARAWQRAELVVRLEGRLSALAVAVDGVAP